MMSSVEVAVMAVPAVFREVFDSEAAAGAAVGDVFWFGRGLGGDAAGGQTVSV
ncbi:hypothetical protein [Gordonia sp. (in: high G+C Gram-positive bacteria)]|uniref:hypothetical protein n=1 Tax=Gordonia sp. (in: high G+C Gram-positive bacteria) TaxID=84139 RepID=UPI003C7768FE